MAKIERTRGRETNQRNSLQRFGNQDYHIPRRMRNKSQRQSTETQRHTHLSRTRTSRDSEQIIQFFASHRLRLGCRSKYLWHDDVCDTKTRRREYEKATKGRTNFKGYGFKLLTEKQPLGIISFTIFHYFNCALLWQNFNHYWKLYPSRLFCLSPSYITLLDVKGKNIPSSYTRKTHSMAGFLHADLYLYFTGITLCYHRYQSTYISRLVSTL